MGHSNAREITVIGAAHDARHRLYKSDHPRSIDRYIDFFGTGAPRREIPDRSGELLLELLA